MRYIYQRSRAIVAILLTTLVYFAAARAEVTDVTRPEVSEQVCPLVPITPIATDGHHGTGIIRKPPGDGPFPALVWVHGGLTTRSAETLEEYARYAHPGRYLAAGYVVAVVTYRSRDHDPQSTVSRNDVMAAVDFLRTQPYVDPESIVVYGCSGGGDLALEVAAASDVTAIAAEEPASILLTGIFNKAFPKVGDRFTARDASPITADPDRYYTQKYQEITRNKLARISCPVFILHGNPDYNLNRFNARVLFPELEHAGVELEVKTYPDQPHCFAFYGRGPRTPDPAAALQAFRDTDAFFRRHLGTQPAVLESEFVHHVPAD